MQRGYEEKIFFFTYVTSLIYYLGHVVFLICGILLTFFFKCLNVIEDLNSNITVGFFKQLKLKGFLITQIFTHIPSHISIPNILFCLRNLTMCLIVGISHNGRERISWHVKPTSVQSASFLLRSTGSWVRTSLWTFIWAHSLLEAAPAAAAPRRYHLCLSGRPLTEWVWILTEVSAISSVDSSISLSQHLK